jgi:two-component system sensor histidine kinase KdpD
MLMKKNAFFGNKWLRDTLISIAVFAVSVGISFFLENVFSVGEHVTTFFVFAVFVVSVLTDGFIYGIAMAAAGVVFINSALTIGCC